MPLLSIRPATPADSGRFARLHFLSHTTAFKPLVPADWIAAREIEAYEDDWRRRLGTTDPRLRAWIAFEGEEVVGIFSACAPADARTGGDGTAETPTALLRALHIHPDRHGTGVGRHLWRTAIAFVGERGCVRARFDVIEANARARRFFDAAGCRVVDRAPIGVEGVPIVTYEIDIGPVAPGAPDPQRAGSGVSSRDSDSSRGEHA